MNYFFITRRQHDAILEQDPDLLRTAFGQCESRQWSIDGVGFFDLPKETIEDLQIRLAKIHKQNP